jgi:thiamine biosynthesis lipoprotein
MSFEALRSFPFSAMGCPAEMMLCGQDAPDVAENAITEVRRIERAYSRYLPDSVTSAINKTAVAGGAIDVDEETSILIDAAYELYRLSDGLFDISSGPLRAVWNDDMAAPPQTGPLIEVMARTGLDKVEWKRPRLTFHRKGMELDFGGLAKEYAADRAAGTCRTLGSARGIVDLGGDLALFGQTPDRSPWRVGIADPDEPSRAIATLFVEGNAGVATSGIYRRFWKLGGKRYGHIFDPRTGWPVEGLASVTVVAETCAQAGALSTIAMLMGGAGASWLAKQDAFHIHVDQSRRLGGSPLGAAA